MIDVVAAESFSVAATAVGVARYEDEGLGGERKKPVGEEKSKKQWSDQWQEEAKRMSSRKEQ